jgi:hypothetical protein
MASLEQLAKLGDKLCEVTQPRKPHYCPLWPDCGCRWADVPKPTKPDKNAGRVSCSRETRR